jgi:hypothetical protein
VRALLALILLVHTAHAETYVMERGQTLQHVADAYGCSVEAVMRANHVKTTLVKAGTVVIVPSCSLHKRAQTRTRTSRPRMRVTTDDDRARAALAVIDGASWVDDAAADERADDAPRRPARSVGVPWDGELVGGEQLPRGAGYRVRRPERAFGAPHVVDHLRHCIAEVRALYPDVHTLAIGDLSAEHGGKLAAHHSHQSGVDVDVGFYFTLLPDGYPEHFAAAGDTLDLQATWALITAFARTNELRDGVQIMFLDYAVQRRLYRWAHERGTPEADLEALFQYPRGKDAHAGLIRHWPNHTDHVHVRFKRP